MAAENEIEEGIKQEEIGESEEKQEKEAEETVFTLEILPIIKEAQQRHGLRHGDYQRYRQYCARRLGRIRHSLHFSLGSRHGYKGKRLTKEIVNNVRYLQIPLMNAERVWSYAMELKLLANTEPRKKFHMTRKLKKSVAYAEELYNLCDCDKVDARTKLESQAYLFWMTANLKFELQDWQSAIDLYGKARTIYEKLASAFIDDTKLLYLQRGEEITPNIRYCAYNLGEDSVDINDLVNLRMHAAGQDLLVSKIDAAISQTREKLASNVGEVSWRGRTVPVRNEKARVFILRMQSKDEELQRADGSEEKIEAYDDFLMECKEAVQSLKEDLNAEMGPKGQKNESVIASMKFIQTYLTFLRHSLTIERNLVMIESLKTRLPGLTGGNEAKASKGKATRPEDLMKMYDITIQSLVEISQLPGIEDDESLLAEVQAQITGYKAFRCFYIAQSYHNGKKLTEAIALYEKVTAYVNEALQLFASSQKSLFVVDVDKLQELSNQAKGQRCAAHAVHILESGDIEEGVGKITLNDKPLKDRLDVYQEVAGAALKKPNLVNFPPSFEPIPCKPLFFDLALNHLELPDLEGRVEQKKAAGGITGLVKGWLWGN
eukprot:gene8838-9784_t